MSDVRSDNRFASNVHSFARSKSARRMGTAWMFVALLVIATACSGVSYQLGRKVTDLDVLEEALTLRQSTPEDVRAVLGEPTGDGAVMMPMMDSKPRTVLTYYYNEGRFAATEGTVSGDARLMLLLIYFDNDRYDGYMWFSSLPEYEDEFKRLGGTVVE